jgi:hypothetical protein
MPILPIFTSRNARLDVEQENDRVRASQELDIE